MKGALSAYGETLAECQAVAAMFDNTCDTSAGKAASVADITAIQHSCKDTGLCGGVTSGSFCVLPRRLCVTCEVQNTNEVYMYVQTNGVPNHCYRSTANAAAALDINAYFRFGRNLSSDPENVSVSSSADLDAVLCDDISVRDADIPAATDYT